MPECCTVNLVKLATDKTLDFTTLLLQVTSIKWLPVLATLSLLPVVSFTKLTVGITMVVLF